MQQSRNPRSSVPNATVKAWHQVLLASGQQASNVLYFFSSHITGFAHNRRLGIAPAQEWGLWESFQLSYRPLTQASGRTVRPPSCGRPLVQHIMCPLKNDAFNTTLF